MSSLNGRILKVGIKKAQKSCSKTSTVANFSKVKNEKSIWKRIIDFLKKL